MSGNSNSGSVSWTTAALAIWSKLPMLRQRRRSPAWTENRSAVASSVSTGLAAVGSRPAGRSALSFRTRYGVGSVVGEMLRPLAVSAPSSPKVWIG